MHTASRTLAFAPTGPGMTLSDIRFTSIRILGSAAKKPSVHLRHSLWKAHMAPGPKAGARRGF